MSDPATITNLLSQTMIGDTKTIKQAEKSLENLHHDPNFLHNLLLIPKENTIPYNIQKAAILYTLPFTRYFVIDKNQPFLNSISEYLLKYISDNTLPLSLRRYLATTIQYILSKDKDYSIRSLLTGNYLQILQASNEQSDTNINFQFLGLVAQILIGSAQNISKQLLIFIQQSFPILISLNLRLLTYAFDFIVKSQNRAEILQCLRVLKIYSAPFKLYMRKIVISDLQTVKILYEEKLAQLISISMNLCFPNNELDTKVIYFQNNCDTELVEVLHGVKADYVTGIGLLMRTLLQNFKQIKMLSANSIVQSPVLLPSLIKGVGELLSKLPYNLIKSQSLIKLIEQILNVFIICVRNNFFFKIFQQHKEPLLYGCIFKILEFSPGDYENLFYQPDEFINQVLHIIQMDPYGFISSRKKDHLIETDDFNNEQIQSYSTLRTVAATFLESYCNTIDGTLLEILNYIINVLKGAETNFPKSLLLMLLGVLQQPAGKREGFVEWVCELVTEVISCKELPGQLQQCEIASKQKKEENISYLMLLLIFFKYLPKYKGKNQGKTLPIIFQLICQLLNRKQTPQAVKSISYDLITILCSLQTENKMLSVQFGLKFVQILNILINSSNRDLEKVLETIFELFKIDSLCEKMMEGNGLLVIGTVNNLAQVIFKEVQKKNLSNQLFINKAWNVIQDISENQVFIPILIPNIEEAIMPLLPFIDEKFELDYEENIFMLMSSFIKKAKSVTQNQLIMFEIIPKLFYNQYKRTFVHAFETLQIFIYYGSNILATAPQAIMMIIQMSISSFTTTQNNKKPRSEAENCEGVLVLQSLILSCGNSFTYEMWMTIAKALTNRIDNPPVRGDILKSNIFATLLLVVMIGNNFFSPDENDLILNRVLQNYHCFTVKYSIKVAIISLAQIFAHFQQPYVQNRYAYLLDTLLCLLEIYEKKNELFEKDQISDEAKDYSLYLDTLFNMITVMNEIEHVKNKMIVVKENNGQALKQAVNQLPNNRKDFLNQLMSISKVHNQSRKIFKIKS